MSFSRDNYNYKSLPLNSATIKSNLNMSQKQTNQQIPSNKAQPVINTEEFAKLDALLQDLLAEVDQPILLNKEMNTKSTLPKSSSIHTHRQTTHSLKTNKNNNNNNNNNNNIDDIEKSVDWLNEQKELLKSRKENLNTTLTNTNNNNNNINTNNMSYLNESNEKGAFNLKNGFSYATADNMSKFKNQQTETNVFAEQFNNTNLSMSSASQTQSSIVNNKPPVSPNSRNLNTPISQHQSIGASTSFRSLSTNPALLKNINETDDEVNNINDPEFDRFSQRSYKSTASTMQRSKYHLVSNDFTEVTRPSAPTPVPTLNRSGYQSKRALSAPPTEIGKVVLQRMELKSPLTVRQGSVVPFERQPAPLVQTEQIIQQQPVLRGQTPVSYTIATTRNYIDNPYNNRGILKTNQVNLDGNATLQQVPARSVYLNRSYSETPRIGYTNGYETDSDLVTNNGYVYRNGGNSRIRTNVIDSDVESYNGGTSRNGYRIAEATNYRYGNNNINNNNTGVINNVYRTLGPRYQVINDQSGYDTDTGLIKLRQVLDNGRRVSNSNSNIQLQNGGYTIVQNRCVTPSFNYHYNQLTPQQQQQTLSRQYNNSSQSNIQQIPIHDARFMNHQNQFVDIAYVDTNQGENEFIQAPVQQISNIEYIDADGNLVKEIVETTTTQELSPQSIIIQQQMAPSAYAPEIIQVPNNNNNSIAIQHQQIPIRDTPSRLGMTTSASNLSSIQKQQQQQMFASQQQIKDDSRRGSSSSLVAATDEVLRDHPKHIKATQSFWYKPKISRDEAISLLKDKPPGTFLIRDSNNFPGAYGLALKVDKPPANVQLKPGADPTTELVRHFLIEPTTKGVRIKGCCNEPVFGSLAALVYQHSLTQLALPIKLILPTQDLATKSSEQTSTIKNSKSSSNNNNNIQDARHLLEKGAACNVYYLNSVNVENRQGLEAISYALQNTKAFTNKDSSQMLLIQFKVTSQGVTLTDLNKKKFTRLHLPTNSVNYCAVNEKFTWPHKLDKIQKPKIFGVVSKPKITTGNNECHLFVELDPDQPAIAIVDFINRYLIPSKNVK